MDQTFCEVENTDPEQHKKWLEKHGFEPDENGQFRIDKFEGRTPVEVEKLFENIRTNVSAGHYEPLRVEAYDERTFVMVCGGPSLEDHLEGIRAKAKDPDKYLVVCSNMTGNYLLGHGITPHVHFILDPQHKKKYDVETTSRDTQYWINVGCDPAVFETLKDQGVTPYAFLADFEAGGKAVQAVKEASPRDVSSMMAIQGGTMAGLRALNLAEARGFRKMEYYGFDGSVVVKDGRAKPYAYEKKRGEAIIEVTCDLCGDKFDTTLVLQKQVNEFLEWRHRMPWVDVKIIGGGLIAHYAAHIREPAYGAQRFTPEYKRLQQDLHRSSKYGVTGSKYAPTIFQAIAQLAKRHGNIAVLDYGSSTGGTLREVADKFWIPGGVEQRCYDPFVDEFAAEPLPADLVICTDVMEHVEPECTKAVLDHIASLTKRLAFFSISLREANKTLADGRNAHINLPGVEWWLKEITRRFIVSEAKVNQEGTDLLVVAQSIEDVRETIRKRRVVS